MTTRLLIVGALCLLGVVEAASLPSDQIFHVVSQQDNMEFYTIDGMQNPALTLTRGNTYVFMLPDSSDHPFWITTQAHSIRGDNAYTNGVVYNGVAHRVGNVTFTVPLDAPDLLHYDCQYHASMTGPLSIIWGLSPGVHNNGIEKGTIMFLVPLSAPDTLYYNCQYHPDMTAVITIQDHTDKSPPLNVTTVFNVTHDFALAYMMGGKHNPALTLLRGHTYQFNLDCEGHPFNIKVVQGVGVTGRYIYNGVGAGVVGSVPTRIIVHGIVNSIAWVILLPLGILMARYGKGAIGHKTFWFLFHRACQCVAVIACAVGWSLGSFWVCGSDTYECNSPTPHALVGTFITVVALVQPVNAFIRPHVHADHEPTLLRKVWFICHAWLGRGAVAVSFYQLHLGLQIVKTNFGLDPFYFNLWIGYVTFLSVTIVALELHLRLCRRPTVEPYSPEGKKVGLHASSSDRLDYRTLKD